ncbi:divalent-cation tolerance protein CutA [Candidatus Omnitrophota bacterium]
MKIVVFVTAANIAQAKKIAQALIKEKLAACVNIVNPVQSLFWWDNKVDSAKEALLVIKTKKSLFKRLITKVRSLHSYDVPEIIALPIVAGYKPYLDWIDGSVRRKGN